MKSLVPLGLSLSAAALVLFLAGSSDASSAASPPAGRVFSGMEVSGPGFTDLFTVPAGSQFVLTDAWAANTNASFYVNDAPGSDKMFAESSRKSIWRSGFVMESGETLRAVASPGYNVCWSGYFQ